MLHAKRELAPMLLAAPRSLHSVRLIVQTGRGRGVICCGPDYNVQVRVCVCVRVAWSRNYVYAYNTQICTVCICVS